MTSDGIDYDSLHRCLIRIEIVFLTARNICFDFFYHFAEDIELTSLLVEG